MVSRQKRVKTLIDIEYGSAAPSKAAYVLKHSISLLFVTRSLWEKIDCGGSLWLVQWILWIL